MPQTSSLMPDLPIVELGGKLALHEHHPGLQHLEVGLSWDETGTAPALDLDVSAFLLDDGGKVRQDFDFIFYNNRKSSCGSVRHSGDERAATSQGDNETVLIDLENVPEQVQKITLVASIYKGEKRGQSFQHVQNARIHLFNRDTEQDIASYDLRARGTDATATIFGEIYRTVAETELPPTAAAAEHVHLTTWQFCLIGQGDEGGLKAIAKDFGVNL